MNVSRVCFPFVFFADTPKSAAPKSNTIQKESLATPVSLSHTRAHGRHTHTCAHVQGYHTHKRTKSDGAISTQEYISCFEISVNTVLPVQEFKRDEQLLRNASNLRLIESMVQL